MLSSIRVWYRLTMKTHDSAAIMIRLKFHSAAVLHIMMTGRILEALQRTFKLTAQRTLRQGYDEKFDPYMNGRIADSTVMRA